MQETMFYLMHRNDPVCTVSIDPVTGAMLRVSQKKEQELMLFAFMDGKPLCTFEDSWYCTMYTDSDEF